MDERLSQFLMGLDPLQLIIQSEQTMIMANTSFFFFFFLKQPFMEGHAFYKEQGLQERLFSSSSLSILGIFLFFLFFWNVGKKSRRFTQSEDLDQILLKNNNKFSFSHITINLKRKEETKEIKEGECMLHNSSNFILNFKYI